ncbi:hypothetical protein CLV99_3691 [Sphingobacterium yanglingense]|uniref:Uncharacterized protein n=1 Tax=Sphingobacterium yanglingense TaxID=1437280 RepID=A0A4R6W9V8_9SPHI|nr:hypothetical protein CLV99_3691 [Sphingobacterium yanglingense]
MSNVQNSQDFRLEEKSLLSENNNVKNEVNVCFSFIRHFPSKC